MKVLVTGANGQLGYDVIKRLNALGDEPVGADREEFDITDGKATEDYITALRPDVIVHCAAYTAVDKAEDDSHTGPTTSYFSTGAELEMFSIL